jgi:D-lactate dehydrogenase
VTPDFLSGLAAIVGPEGVVTEAAARWVYGYDNSRRHAEPEAVAFATSHEQVRAVVSLCHRDGVSLVARGRGTGTTGSAVPIAGGVVLSLERMRRILRTAPDDRLMVVEPGVTNEEVQREAARHGFFWPPDPTSGAFCTVGGNLALNAAGPRAVKYGTVRENVLGLRAVTGTGEEIRTGVRTTKGVVGYDLTRLIVGSEGTLAIITEATLKLTPLPEARRTLRAFYRDVHSAARAVTRIMCQPVTPSAVEFMDGPAIELVGRYRRIDLPADAGGMLMVEVDGPAACVDGAAQRVEAAAGGEGLVEISRARTDNEVAALWEARKALSPALRSVAPKKINEDVVVPVSRIPELLDRLQSLSRRHAVTIVSFGHAGNGNIHVNLLVNPDDADQLGRAERCLSDVFDAVLALDGTLSGEHGVGIEKRDFVAREIDPVALALMTRIKAQFDPRGILNPGKVLPAPPALRA